MDEKTSQLDVFKTVAEFSSDWLMWMTAGRDVKYASAAAKAITGYEPREFVDDRELLRKIIHPGDREIILREFADNASDFHDNSLEFRIIHKDGSVRWISHRCRPVFDGKKQMAGRISSNSDITEKKLKEKFLQAIFDGIQDPLHVIDRDYRVVLTNKKLLGMKNVRQEEISGKYCYEAYQGRTGLCDPCASRETFADGKPHSLLKVLPLSDGTFRHFEVYAFPLFEENGDVKQVIEMTRDITDRIAAARDMQKMARIVEQAAEAIAITDISGHFEYVNPAFEKITGYSAAEVSGKKSSVLSNGNHPPEFYKEMWDTVAGGGIWRGTFINERKDGISYYDDAVIFPIRDESGTITNYVKIAKDITEFKKSEQALRESEERYRSLFEESQDVIFVSSPEGRFIDINPAGLRLFGYSSLEEIQKIDIAVDMYKNPEERLEYRRLLEKNGSVRDYEHLSKKKDGSEITVLVSSTPVYDSGGDIVAYRGIIRDITDKKILEAQLFQSQKMEAVGTLAGGVAHDFNNLLTVINGYAEMAMLRIDDRDRLCHYISSIQEAGDKAMNLTGQLLAFSRKQIYKPEIVDINWVILSLDKMLRRLLGEDIDMETLLGDRLPMIKADKTQLEQIYMNLAINARDALNEMKKENFLKKITVETGEVFIDADYTSKHHGCTQGRHLFFSVSDNGIGMDEATRRRVFEPFFTTKEKHKGTGLGLAMVYGIVKQNNGSIYLYSEVGRGTTFKIYWPAAQEKDEADRKAAVVEDDISEGSETILMVEDHEAVRSFACESLASLGYNVHEAENGRVALGLVKDGSVKYDLIVTDLIMPELGGKEFVEKARQLYPDVKVIYTSGYTDNHIVHNGMLEDGIHFLHKPYSTKSLSSAVRNVLDNP